MKIQSLFDSFNYKKDSLDYILRANNAIANTTLFWKDSDTEDKFLKNVVDSQKLNNFTDSKKLYWVDKEIEYRFNNYGFRTDDDFEKDEEGIVCLGCSFTQGIGLPIEYTWGYKLAKHLNTRFYNLGQGGKGLTTAFRLLLGCYDLFKIKKVFLFVPPQYRDEFIIEDNNMLKPFLTGVDRDKMLVNSLGSSMYEHLFFGLEESSHNQLMKAWIFGSKKNNLMNYLKGVTSIQGLCTLLGVEFYFLSFDQFYNEEKFKEAEEISNDICPDIPARDDHWSAKRQHLIYQYFVKMYEDNNR